MSESSWGFESLRPHFNVSKNDSKESGSERAPLDGSIGTGVALERRWVMHACAGPGLIAHAGARKRPRFVSARCGPGSTKVQLLMLKRCLAADLAALALAGCVSGV